MLRFSLLQPFLWSMMIISSSHQVVSTNGNLRRESGRKLENANWLSITAYGGDPETHYPLGECEGDCDNDDHCEGDLVCFQREKNEAIVGCNGGEEDNSRTDYCVDPKYLTPSPVPSAAPSGSAPLPIVSIPNSRANTPLGQCVGDCLFDSNCEEGLYCFQRSPYDEVPGCIGGGTDGTSNDFCTAYYYEPAPAPAPTPDMFKLKLYWEDGYYWQEEEFDRLWCMRCFGFPCDVGSKIEIANCTWDSIEYFDFVEVGGSTDVIQIQLFDSDLCLERKNEYDVALDICDDTKSRQQWIELEGRDLDGEKFELTQVGFEEYCLTQHHHPKHGEILELQRCANARIDQSSFWQKY